MPSSGAVDGQRLFDHSEDCVALALQCMEHAKLLKVTNGIRCPDGVMILLKSKSLLSSSVTQSIMNAT
jgi:hypothetical protein